jgi:hypothetical protein
VARGQILPFACLLELVCACLQIKGAGVALKEYASLGPFITDPKLVAHIEKTAEYPLDSVTYQTLAFTKNRHASPGKNNQLEG